MNVRKVKSIEELITSVRTDFSTWRTKTFPWFRGEPAKTSTPLLPELFRYKDGEEYENHLLQQFRMKAPIFDPTNAPPRNQTDKWLFLAQHVGLPTRLLDWTEGLLVALHFALHTRKPGAVVWMLNPIRLNKKASSLGAIAKEKMTSRKHVLRDNRYSLTWLSPENTRMRRSDILHTGLLDDEQIENYVEALQIGPNPGNLNVRGAWERDAVGTLYPVAVHPTNIHPRMSSQRSCFTIHGTVKKSLAELVEEPILFQYQVANLKSERAMKKDLRMMGITSSSLVPDLDGLASDLKDAFLPPLPKNQ